MAKPKQKETELIIHANVIEDDILTWSKYLE